MFRRLRFNMEQHLSVVLLHCPELRRVTSCVAPQPAMRPLVVHAAVCAVFLTEILRGTAGAPVASPKPQLQATVLAEFASVVEFVWPSPAARAAAIANGSYIPENCAISGIRYVPLWWCGLREHAVRGFAMVGAGYVAVAPHLRWQVLRRGCLPDNASVEARRSLHTEQAWYVPDVYGGSSAGGTLMATPFAVHSVCRKRCASAATVSQLGHAVRAISCVFLGKAGLD